jgi:hypothetical protein
MTNTSGIKPAMTAQNSPAPAITIVHPTNGSVVDAPMGGFSVSWQYSANSTFSWIGCSLNGGGNTTVTGKNEMFYIENNGDYAFTLYANDTAGNWATPQTVTFQVHILGDALPINWGAVVAIVGLILTVIVLFALAVIVAYRRHGKQVKKL